MIKKIIIGIAIFVLIIISLIGYGVYSLFNQLGAPVDESKSDSYYYATDGNSIVHSPMGNWFELGKTKMTADVATFIPLSQKFAKDKNRAYYMHRPIATAVDIPSFRVVFEYVPRDKDHIFIDPGICSSDENRICLQILKDADPESYTLLDYNFAKDKNHVYIRDTLAPELDAATFKLVNDYYSKDQHGIYHFKYDKPLTSLEAITFEDTNTIKVYDNSDLLRVDDNVYYDGRLLPKADAESFKTIEGNYFKDKNHIFIRDHIIEEADVASFTLVKFQYAKDNNHVFYNEAVIPNADPDTFEYDENTFQFKDKNAVYVFGKPESK